MVGGGEDFRGGEADGGGDLFPGAAAEGVEGESGGARAGDAEGVGFGGIGPVDVDAHAVAEEAFEVSGDAIGDRLGDVPADRLLGLGEQGVEQVDGLGMTFFAVVFVPVVVEAGEGPEAVGLGVGGAVGGERRAGAGEAGVSVFLPVEFDGDDPVEAGDFGFEGFRPK